MENLIITEHSAYTTIQAAEGYKVTAYTEGDNRFVCGKVVSVPKGSDITKYRAIPDSEATDLATKLATNRLQAPEEAPVTATEDDAPQAPEGNANTPEAEQGQGVESANAPEAESADSEQAQEDNAKTAEATQTEGVEASNEPKTEEE